MSNITNNYSTGNSTNISGISAAARNPTVGIGSGGGDYGIGGYSGTSSDTGNATEGLGSRYVNSYVRTARIKLIFCIVYNFSSETVSSSLFFAPFCFRFSTLLYSTPLYSTRPLHLLPSIPLSLPNFCSHTSPSPSSSSLLPSLRSSPPSHHKDMQDKLGINRAGLPEYLPVHPSPDLRPTIADMLGIPEAPGRVPVAAMEAVVRILKDCQ